jgi:hypothetical protein
VTFPTRPAASVIATVSRPCHGQRRKSSAYTTGPLRGTAEIARGEQPPKLLRRRVRRRGSGDDRRAGFATPGVRAVILRQDPTRLYQLTGSMVQPLAA